MNSEALRLSAKLMDLGANLADLYRQTLNTRSFEAARYWGRGLGHLERAGRMAWTSLSLSDRLESGYMGNDDADLVNILTSIKDCDIAVIFVEQKYGKIKVSWRSEPGYDVSAIAVKFGGGGHAAASGAEISGSLAEVQNVVLQATSKLLKNPGNSGGN
jgi:phosphoesterase RecJ-like protein